MRPARCLAGRAGVRIVDAAVNVTGDFGRDPVDALYAAAAPAIAGGCGDGLAMITADIAVDLAHVSKRLGAGLVENAERAGPCKPPPKRFTYRPH